LARIDRICERTVATDTTNSWAIVAGRRPATIRLTTSRSRGVSRCQRSRSCRATAPAVRATASSRVCSATLSNG
jgi:hypothetical protein